MKIWLVIAAASFAVPAFAGKDERRAMDNLKPYIKEAQDSIKKNCGCSWAISVDDKSFTTYDDIKAMQAPLESYKDKTKEFCTDAASKKAACKISSLVYKKGKESSFNISGKKGVNTIGGDWMHIGFDLMAQKMDK